MTKPRKDVKFNRERQRSSLSDNSIDSLTGDGSPSSPRNGTAKASGRNGSVEKAPSGTASGWATENEGDEVRIHSSAESGEKDLSKDSETDTMIQKMPQPPVESEYNKKKAAFVTRAIWTLVMIAIFFISMFAGHIYVIIIVTAVQIICFKEVIAIANVPSRERSLQFTKTLNWYFLGSTMYFLYGESVIYYFKHIVLIDRVLLPFATHHRFISFMLYVMGMIFPILMTESSTNIFQASSSSLDLSRRATTDSNSLNSPGLTWLFT